MHTANIPHFYNAFYSFLCYFAYNTDDEMGGTVNVSKYLAVSHECRCCPLLVYGWCATVEVCP